MNQEKSNGHRRTRKEGGKRTPKATRDSPGRTWRITVPTQYTDTTNLTGEAAGESSLNLKFQGLTDEEIEKLVRPPLLGWYTITHGPITSHFPQNWKDPEVQPIPSSGIRLGEIEAWRCWWVGDDLSGETCIRSLISRTWWKPGEPLIGPGIRTIEECTINTNSMIAWYMTPAGIHAWKDEQTAVDYARYMLAVAQEELQGLTFHRHDWPTPPISVVGKVALWGDYVEHEKGYRAQYAAPTEFTAILGMDDPVDPLILLGKLRKKYGL